MRMLPRQITHLAGPRLGQAGRYWRRLLCRPRPIDNWFLDHGDETLRLDYPLDSSSVVWDVGGFRGDWAQRIWDRYHCSVHVFEPVACFRAGLAMRFGGNNAITIHGYGLSGGAGRADITVRGDASSIWGHGTGSKESIELREPSEVVRAIGCRSLALVKINIEGGEFDLLPRLIETGLIRNCQNVQVQFHPWVDGAQEKRLNIRRSLNKTHSITYDYPFVWENWRVRE